MADGPFNSDVRLTHRNSKARFISAPGPFLANFENDPIAVTKNQRKVKYARAAGQRNRAAPARVAIVTPSLI